MNTERLKLIKNLAVRIQAENNRKFKGLERQAIQLSDREYIVTNKKVVDNRNELNFN